MLGRLASFTRYELNDKNLTGGKYTKRLDFAFGFQRFEQARGQRSRLQRFPCRTTHPMTSRIAAARIHHVGALSRGLRSVFPVAAC